MFDVIVVGTRVAGASTAMLLARRGLKVADELLATVAGAHHPDPTYRQLAEAAGTAMVGFQQTGDPSHLAGCFAEDLRFTLADGVPQSGRELFAALLAADFADGVRSRLLRVTAGACPPADADPRRGRRVRSCWPCW